MKFTIDLENDHNITVGPHTFRVKYVDRVDTAENWGECNARDHVIRIDRTAPKPMRLSTYIHELMHAIEAVYEVEMAHKDLNTMADVLAGTALTSWRKK